MKILRILFFIFLFCGAKIALGQGTISLYRDSFGVAHIFGESHRDALYGLAYAHAEDNFEAIERMMILSRGRLGELEGVEGAKADFFVAFLNARAVVEKRFETDFSKEFIQIMEGYVEGINKYAAEHPKEVRLKGVFPVNAFDIVTAYTVIFSGMTGVSQALTATMNGKPNEYIFGAKLGSNAAALGSNKTVDGNTYLFINPHVPLEGPMSFYEVHLVSQDGLNFHGCLFPGMISPAMGSSPHHGWGLTFNWPDYVDIHELKMVENSVDVYLYDGKPQHLESSKVKLKVKKGPLKLKVSRDLYWSVYGPTVKVKKKFYSLQINTLEQLNVPEQLFKMAAAKSRQDFEEAVAMQSLPLFNIVYADKWDNISYLFNGKIPDRPDGYNWQKVLRGDTSDTKWKHYIRMEELPQVKNPSSGFVYNTNNSPFFCSGANENPKASDFSEHAAFHWNRLNARDLRFRERIALKEKFSMEDFKTIKYDCTYPGGDYGIGRSLQPLFNIDPNQYPELKEEILLLKGWDKTGTIANKNAALLLVTFLNLNEMTNSGYVEMEMGLKFTEAQLIGSLKKASIDLINHYGSIDVELGKIQKIERADKSFPVSGLPDALNSSYLKRTGKGKFKVANGDTFIMFCSFSAQGNNATSVLPYGVSARKESKHFTDQMKLYAEHRTKKVYFSEAEVKQNQQSLKLLKVK
jgi:acyl-homoserine-lactone acylase